MSVGKIKKSNRSQVGAKKLFGIILLVLSIFVFLFSCVPAFLGIGRFFQGVFGLLVYPLGLLFALIGIALIMDLSYTLNTKYVVYLTLASICLLSLLHIIFTTSVLYDSTTEFNHMGEYLSHCFKMKNGITVGGVLLGIFAYIVRVLLGLVGAYAFFGIFSTIFIGLTIDHLIYNKRKVVRREKLTQEKIYKKIDSDSKIFERDEDLYSFSNTSKNKPPVFKEWEEESDDFEKQTPLFEATDDKTDRILESDSNINFSFNNVEEKDDY